MTVYYVQSENGIRPAEDKWKTISSDRAGHQEFNNLAAAEKAFELNCSLARFIGSCRVIDDSGKIYSAGTQTFGQLYRVVA